MKRGSELGKDEIERAMELHRKAIVIDNMNPSLCSMEFLEYTKKMHDAGVTANGLTLGPFWYTFRQMLESTADFYLKISQNSEKTLLVTTVEDIERAKREGKVGLFYKSNNIHIEGDLRLLRILHKLGFRSLQITYNMKNEIGDGCTERTNCGLSDLGVRVVEEMNKLGMLIDLSHVGTETSKDAIEFSKDPVTFSHSNSRSVADNLRNIPDELVQALAEKGGMVGVNAFPKFVSSKPKPTVDDLLDHIDHYEKLVGIDYVSIGTDLVEGQPMEGPAAEKYWAPLLAKPEVYGKLPWHYALGSISELPNITKGLVARGYSDQEILKILGRNSLRLFRRVWK